MTRNQIISKKSEASGNGKFVQKGFSIYICIDNCVLDQEEDFSERIGDADLLRACNGRTGHKIARIKDISAGDIPKKKKSKSKKNKKTKTGM